MNSETSRRQLAVRMSKRTGVLKKDCERLIDAMIDEMVVEMKSGRGIHLPKLGHFEYYVRRETERFGEGDNEKVEVPPATRIKFKPCRDVRFEIGRAHV